MSSREVDGLSSPLQLVKMLPSYARHPVVADANVLFQDASRYAKTGFTVLTFLAQHEVITLLSCEHVARRLPEIIAERKIDQGAQLRTWRRVYLPLVRFVAVPASMSAGHPQIEAIEDPEDVPFARLAIAVAPSLLLTRDHHFSDVGLGTVQWAEALTLLGDLVELDAALYGGAHSGALFMWLVGLLVRELWRAAAAEPLLSIAAAGLGLLLFLDNQQDAMRRIRGIASGVKNAGQRALEATTPIFERRERIEGSLSSRLETPLLPRDIQSICARHLATARRPTTLEQLLAACRPSGADMSQARLASLLQKHPSFTEGASGVWELGSLGQPIIEGTINS